VAKKKKDTPSVIDVLLGIAETHPNILLGSVYENFEVPVITTGNTVLNLLLRGGLPVSRFVEVFGEVSQGKTSLAYQAMAGCNSEGGYCVYVNAENAWNPKRARQMGVNLALTVVIPPCSLEDVFAGLQEIILRIRTVDMACPILVVWDTIAMSSLEAELDAELESPESDAEEDGEGKPKQKRHGMAASARTLRECLRKLTVIIYQHKVAVVLLNQVIQKIPKPGQKMFGPTTTTPGGGAPKFMSSIRLEVQSKGKYKCGGEVLGIVSQVRVIKSNLFRPFDSADIVITFDHGVDEVFTLSDTLYRQKLVHPERKDRYVDQDGGWFSVLTPAGETVRCRHQEIPRLVGEHDGMLKMWQGAAYQLLRLP